MLPYRGHNKYFTHKQKRCFGINKSAPVLGHNVLQLPCQLSEQVVEPAAEVRKEKAALTVDKQR